MKKLDMSSLDRWTATHDAWSRVSGTAIAREVKLPDFKTALALVNKVGVVAETKNHHPDIELGWGRVRFVLTTHDAGGVTQLDLDMAEAIDKMV